MAWYSGSPRFSPKKLGRLFAYWILGVAKGTPKKAVARLPSNSDSESLVCGANIVIWIFIATGHIRGGLCILHWGLYIGSKVKHSLSSNTAVIDAGPYCCACVLLVYFFELCSAKPVTMPLGTGADNGDFISPSFHLLIQYLDAWMLLFSRGVVRFSKVLSRYEDSEMNERIGLGIRGFSFLMIDYE
jgi:hypothetical protein